MWQKLYNELNTQNKKYNCRRLAQIGVCVFCTGGGCCMNHPPWTRNYFLSRPLEGNKIVWSRKKYWTDTYYWNTFNIRVRCQIHTVYVWFYSTSIPSVLIHFTSALVLTCIYLVPGMWYVRYMMCVMICMRVWYSGCAARGIHGCRICAIRGRVPPFMLKRATI